jgi:hypothetical protein
MVEALHIERNLRIVGCRACSSAGGICVAALTGVQVHRRPETIRYRLDFLESTLPGNKRVHERVRQGRPVLERTPGAGQPIVANSWVVRAASIPGRLLRIGGLSREQDRGNKNFIACHDTLALSQESSPAVAAENQLRNRSATSTGDFPLLTAMNLAQDFQISRREKARNPSRYL